MVARVDFFQKGILKNVEQSPTTKNSTLSKSFPNRLPAGSRWGSCSAQLPPHPASLSTRAASAASLCRLRVDCGHVPPRLLPLARDAARPPLSSSLSLSLCLSLSISLSLCLSYRFNPSRCRCRCRSGAAIPAPAVATGVAPTVATLPKVSPRQTPPLPSGSSYLFPLPTATMFTQRARRWTSRTSSSIWSAQVQMRGRGRGPGGRGGSRLAGSRPGRQQASRRPRPCRSSRRARDGCSGAGRGVGGSACKDHFTLFGHVSTVLLQRPRSHLSHRSASPPPS